MAAPQPGAMNAARWRWVALACCLLVLALLGAQVALHGRVLALDNDVSGYWMVNHSPALTSVMRWLSILHEQAVVLVAAAIVAVFLGMRRDWQSARAMLVVPTGMVLNVVVKNAFHRPRPHWEDPMVRLTTYSFPSGHAVAATVFWGMACALVFAHTRSRAWRALAVVVAGAMIGLVCFSRVYLGAHYPSDVVAGVALGLSCVLVFLRLLRR